MIVSNSHLATSPTSQPRHASNNYVFDCIGQTYIASARMQASQRPSTASFDTNPTVTTSCIPLEIDREMQPSKTGACEPMYTRSTAVRGSARLLETTM